MIFGFRHGSVDSKSGRFAPLLTELSGGDKVNLFFAEKKDHSYAARLDQHPGTNVRDVLAPIFQLK